MRDHPARRLAASRIARLVGREAPAVKPEQGHYQELPFAVRMRMLRQARRRMTLHQLTDEALWIAIVAAVVIIVATELIVAIGRA